MQKKTSQQSQQITKRLLIVGDSIVLKKKWKKSTKYITTVKSIPGATTEGMNHHVKGCMVNFAPDIVLLDCGTNDFKKYLTSKPHRIYWSWQKRYLTEIKEMSWFLELSIRVMILMLKWKRHISFCLKNELGKTWNI